MLDDMEEVKSPRDNERVKVIKDAEVAKVLMDLKTLERLEPFMQNPRSIKEVALEKNIKANSLLIQVRRFVNLGLLVIAKEQSRQGRAIKLYQSSADIFYIPYEVTSSDTLEDALAARDAYWGAMLRKNIVDIRLEDVGVYGTRIYKDARGRLQIQTAINPYSNYTTLADGKAAALSAWRDNLMLDYEDAKNLQREMFALLKKYHAKRGAQRYILRLGLSPIRE